MSDFKTIVIDGVEWEEQGPYCEICGAHMGELYSRETEWFENPNHYEEYGNNKCPKCGQTYGYIESNSVILSAEQLELLREHAGLEEE